MIFSHKPGDVDTVDQWKFLQRNLELYYEIFLVFFTSFCVSGGFDYGLKCKIEEEEKRMYLQEEV